jgi:hypothetical protein
MVALGAAGTRARRIAATRFAGCQVPDAWEADIDMVHGFQAGTPRRRSGLAEATDDATLGDSKGRALFIRQEAPGDAEQSLQVMVNWQSALQPN